VTTEDDISVWIAGVNNGCESFDKIVVDEVSFIEESFMNFDVCILREGYSKLLEYVRFCGIIAPVDEFFVVFIFEYKERDTIEF